MDNIRILLADDHAIVRAGLKVLIDAHDTMEVVGEANDGRAAIEQVAALKPNVVIMDISMGSMNGIEATTHITEHSPATKVLVLSMHEHVGYVRRLLAAGASGYILKRSVADVLIQAIQTVATGGVYLDSAPANAVATQMSAQSATRTQPTGALSERETEVLQLIAAGYISKEIAAQIGVSSKTVETYKARAMEKLGLSSRVAVVRYALEQGWLQHP